MDDCPSHESLRLAFAVKKPVADLVAQSLAPEGSLDQVCVMCDSKTAEKCSRCQVAYYCSKSCQEKDWKFHRHLCRISKHFFPQTRKRPTRAHHRAILFHPTCNNIDFMWVKNTVKNSTKPPQPTYAPDDQRRRYEVIVSTDDGIVQVHLSHMDGSLDRPDHIIQAKVATLINAERRMWSTERKIDKLLVAVAVEEEPDLRMPHETYNCAIPNKTILEMGEYSYSYLWWGPVCLMGFKLFTDAHGDTRLKLQDVSMRNLRDAIDFFHSHRNNPVVIDPERFPDKTISALKVDIVWDVDNTQKLAMLGLGPGFIEEVTIPLESMKAQVYGLVGAWSVGLRWFVRAGGPVSPSNTIPDQRAAGEARHLHHCFQVERDETTGEEHINYIQMNPNWNGAVLVYDATGKPIPQGQLPFLNYYLDDIDRFGDIASRQDFVTFWGGCCMAERECSNHHVLGNPYLQFADPFSFGDPLAGDRLADDSDGSVPAVVDSAILKLSQDQLCEMAANNPWTVEARERAKEEGRHRGDWTRALPSKEMLDDMVQRKLKLREEADEQIRAGQSDTDVALRERARVMVELLQPQHSIWRR